MKVIAFFAVFAALLITTPNIRASDRSDAMDLKDKCDKESRIIEIPLKNFGDEKDLDYFASGLELIKQGKVRIAQSKFLEAKARFEEYLKMQKQIYESLVEKYLARTRDLIDRIAEDLADFVGDDAVLKVFATASQNYESAKELATRKQFENAIQPCRIAKNAVISVYTMVKKEIPEEYKKDVSDFNNKIFEARKSK